MNVVSLKFPKHIIKDNKIVIENPYNNEFFLICEKYFLFIKVSTDNNIIIRIIFLTT